MPITVKHAFVSGKPAGPDPGLVQGPHWDAEHVVTGTGTVPVGCVQDYVGHSVPSGWLECAGQLLGAGAYPLLFQALVKSSVVTITIANPGVVSWPAHGLWPFSPVFFISSSALPGGIGQGARYYVSANGYAANSFRISASINGPDIATTGTQAGVHTAIFAPYGALWDLTQFNLPDFRDVVLGGISNMAGSGLSGRLPAHNLGEIFGAEKTVLLIENLPAHNHGSLTGVQNVGHTHGVSGTISGTTDFADLTHNHAIDLEQWNDASGGGSHHVLQPNTQTGHDAIAVEGTRTAALNHQHALSGSFSGNTGAEANEYGGDHRHGIASQGSGTGHSNVQPTSLVRKIIYAGL